MTTWPTYHLTKCQTGPISHIWEYIWSNDNLTLHYHLTKCWPDPTQSLILGGTSYQVSTLPYISSDQMSKWSYISSSGVHLIKCQPDPTSYLTKCQTGPISHHLGYIWPNVDLTYISSDQMSNWPYISYLGVHLIKWQPDPTFSSDQILTWPDSKPHTGEHIWPNVNLNLHLIWPNVKVVLHLILGGTSDQMLTWIYIWSDQMSKRSYISSWGDIWSNVDLTLHLHLTKYQSDLTQCLIVEGTSDQMSTWPYISSHQMSNWPSISSLGVICPNVNLTLHLIWPNVKVVLHLIFRSTSDQMPTWSYISYDLMSNWPYISYLGVHLIKWQPDPTSSSNQISTWPDSKPHTGGHIWPNVNLTLHLIWPNVKVVLHLILQGEFDQMSTWPYIFI